MSNQTLKWLIIIVLAIAAFFTNPKYHDHVESIDVEFRKKNLILGTLRGSKALTTFCKYQDCVVFSVTYVEGDKNDKKSLVSIGFLNKVVVVQNLDIG